MRALAVIPARYNSSRLPGKPLIQLGGRPLIQWVYEATISGPSFDKVVVATDDTRVADVVKSFGGEVEITGSGHLSGTDRVAEVAALYPEMEVVANVQGDQPFVTGQMLARLVEPYFQGETPDMTTLACDLGVGDAKNPNIVKVVCARDWRALYFSRAPIPYAREAAKSEYLQHLGLYAFRRDFLIEFAHLGPSRLEVLEGLEQLRALDYGFTIRVSRVDFSIIEVNTPDDLERAEEVLTKAQRGGRSRDK